MDKMLDYVDKIRDVQDKYLTMLEKRVVRLEKGQKRLNKQYVTVYNWHYARVKRRTAQDRRALETAKSWANTMKRYNPMFLQLATLAAEIKQGRKLMTLTSRERRKLVYNLRKKAD